MGDGVIQEPHGERMSWEDIIPETPYSEPDLPHYSTDVEGAHLIWVQRPHFGPTKTYPELRLRYRPPWFSLSSKMKLQRGEISEFGERLPWVLV